MKELIRCLDEEAQLYAQKRWMVDKDTSFLTDLIFQLGRELDDVKKSLASVNAQRRHNETNEYNKASKEREAREVSPV